MLWILTIVNILVLTGWILVVRYFNVPFRRVLAMAPTPMLGFASSYGVFAYNQLLTPSWVAVIMAAAYEVTYVGIAAYTALSNDQLGRGQRIAKIAASISFLQNAIAAMFYIMPEIVGYRGHGVWTFVVNLCFAFLHAAQVWVAYLAANYTLHDQSSTIEQPATVNNVNICVKTVNVDEKRTAVDEPKRLPQVVDEDTVTMPTVKYKTSTGTIDARAEEWLRRNDGGESYEEIANDKTEYDVSRQHIGKHVKRLREVLLLQGQEGHDEN